MNDRSTENKTQYFIYVDDMALVAQHETFV